MFEQLVRGESGERSARGFMHSCGRASGVSCTVSQFSTLGIRSIQSIHSRGSSNFEALTPGITLNSQLSKCPVYLTMRNIFYALASWHQGYDGFQVKTIMVFLRIIMVWAFRQIPTMTKSHHGGNMSLIGEVGFCHRHIPTIDNYNDEVRLGDMVDQLRFLKG